GETARESNCTAGAEWRVLVRIDDFHLSIPASDRRFELLGHVTRRKHGPPNAGLNQLIEQVSQERPPANRRENLGPIAYDRSQPRPEAAGKNDCVYVHKEY